MCADLKDRGIMDEAPKIPHVVSRNASNTEPAKLLVWMLSNEEEGIKVPIDK
jgi:hypothetical protein